KAKPKSKPRARRPSKRAAPTQQTLINRGTVGVRLGATFAWASDDHRSEATEADYETELGGVAGVVYDKALNQFLHYRVGAQYHGRGFATEAGGKTTTATLRYIEVPLEVGVHFQASRTVTPYINIGAYLGALIDKEVRVGGDKKKELEDRFSTFDYGMNVSVGAWFPMTRTLASAVALTYSHGFADIVDHDADGVNVHDEDQTFNRAFYIVGQVHF
ncbi:MAG: PorT family protein, partial [Myxococcales bacterium]|nr:PorT family protein [Myxococcales bacterium]